MNDRRLFGLIKKKGGTHMEVQDLMTIISTLGFPIAACIAMFSMLNKERDQRIQEMEKFTEAINNNTLALKALEGKLHKDG